MSKFLLLIVVVVLGVMVLVLLSQAGIQQAQLESLRAQVDQLQQQNHVLVAQQAQLNSEKENLLSQSQQLGQYLTSLQAAYQQEHAQNQLLQAEIAAAEQPANGNASIVFWAGLVGLLAMATGVPASFAIARRLYRAQNHGDQPIKSPADTLWASQKYREQAIQKARLIELWERHSVLAYWNSHRISLPNHQTTTTTIPR